MTLIWQKRLFLFLFLIRQHWSTQSTAIASFPRLRLLNSELIRLSKWCRPNKREKNISKIFSLTICFDCLFVYLFVCSFCLVCSKIKTQNNGLGKSTGNFGEKEKHLHMLIQNNFFFMKCQLNQDMELLILLLFVCLLLISGIHPERCLCQKIRKINNEICWIFQWVWWIISLHSACHLRWNPPCGRLVIRIARQTIRLCCPTNHHRPKRPFSLCQAPADEMKTNRFVAV